ncbi:hypothetical protein jhhlp_003088 [Lomentospora prolificans]|uniref:DUF7726 domain-containing protein n=1 Tax=Lomentospora prolificans TaxID=41688 RepID=A0A2N3NFS5_9PEZI|nr:hypothetical protein jhhlp_003088 [Lomentospora prolificans]
MASNLSPGTTRRVTIDSLLLQFLDTHPVNPNAALSYYTNPNNVPNYNSHNANSNYASTAPGPGPLPGVRPPLATADANRPVSTLSASMAPVVGRKRKGGPSMTPEESDPASKKARKSAFSATGPFYLDVSSVNLPGEATHSVPVYDMCDTVRRKIRAALRRDGVTQAAFLRAIAATYSDGRKIQNKQLNDFLSKKGPLSGNRSCIYYAAYVFFEKVRIRDGKDKDKDRLAVEKQWPGGVDTVRDCTYVWTRADAVHMGRYGGIHSVHYGKG